MNRRDELRERYEDALFAFLMEDVIETEGKKMFEEKINCSVYELLPGVVENTFR